MDFTAEKSAEIVSASFDAARDPRAREVLQALTRHLHAFVREIRPSMAEWEQAIDFLTRTGRTCTDTRQEFILLSDVLGVSMLVETLEAEHTTIGATPATVLGPFHMVASPPRELGDSIDLVADGTPCVIEGRITDTHGNPLPGASVDVWQADDKGFYDVQQPGTLPEGNGRGLFTADEEGRYRFRTVRPAPYPIPVDGPVGELLDVAGRHPYRPAHVHFIVAAEGHHPVTTHAFAADSAYIDSDTVFAVKRDLIVDFVTVDDPAEAARHGVTAPFRHARFDIALAPANPPSTPHTK
ncbi:6-chlorohydroxyquinol-1,2-dioxygenase [Allokutzneria sp. A3M-2-11 16]|uniref:dioxygenase family protein n=1 Tax=Allokutzneria sp. A3M-2-11 16 TaxID=2962043 RepID=UPI0020B7A29D|nr:dioxygenase [Allokutzneria sp. A3M-2-11 16]MCP3804979.1 6-chlorohydroxyquinol-1,2-dioxygenase [Allokutzneria sp. A3M-2-11 16]